MKKAICISAIAATLSGCATWGQFDTGLNTLIGKPVSLAVDVLGYPSGEREIVGMHLIQWGRSSQGFMPVSTPIQSYGTVATPRGFGSFSTTTMQTSMVPVSYNCSITLQVDANNIVTGYNYEGNLGGCRTYIQRLKKYRKQTGQ